MTWFGWLIISVLVVFSLVFTKQFLLSITWAIAGVIKLISKITGKMKEIPQQEKEKFKQGEVKTAFELKEKRKDKILDNYSFPFSMNDEDQRNFEKDIIEKYLHLPFARWLLKKYFSAIRDAEFARPYTISYEERKAKESAGDEVKKLVSFFRQTKEEAGVFATDQAAVYYFVATPEDDGWNGKTIFSLGGRAGSDPEEIAPINYYYFKKGYRVISASYPCARGGLATPDYLWKSALSFNNVDPHLEFFEAMIDYVVGDDDFIFSGYSMGGNLGFGLIARNNLPQMKEANIISPACMNDRQSFWSFLTQNRLARKNLPRLQVKFRGKQNGIVNARTVADTFNFRKNWLFVRLILNWIDRVKTTLSKSSYANDLILLAKKTGSLGSLEKLKIFSAVNDEIVNSYESSLELILSLKESLVDQSVVANLEELDYGSGHASILDGLTDEVLRKVRITDY